MTPVKKLASWWRGPTDAETVALEAEQHRDGERRDTIRISQSLAGKQTDSSLVSAPTPDLLDPGRKDRQHRR